MDLDFPWSNTFYQIHFSCNDSKFQESPLFWPDRWLRVVIVAHTPECILTTANWPWPQITAWHRPGKPLTGGRHTRRWPLTHRTAAKAETKQLEDTHFPCGWAIHGRREGGALVFQFSVHCWKESRVLTLSRCSLYLRHVHLQHVAAEEWSFDSGGWGLHLAVVNSRRRNLITPFTITSQPPRGLDTRLGNCCRRKCSLKLTSPGTGTETRETTKAFRQMQDHSTYDVPLWGRNLVAYRVHTHKHTNKVYIWLKNNKMVFWQYFCQLILHSWNKELPWMCVNVHLQQIALLSFYLSLKSDPES